MKSYNAFFIFEAKRFFCKRNSIIITMLLFTSLLFIQLGINDYNNLLDRKEKFQEIEKNKVSMYLNYSQYGTYGFRMLFVPAPISVFFIHSCVIPNLTAYADSGERLKIYLPLKGRNIFDLRKNGMADFSGILLFFGSLMALIYGYDSIRKDEYMRFLSSLLNKKKVFFCIIISRVLLLYILILAIMVSALLLMVINGFPIPFDKYLLYFLLMIFLITLFFFVLGTVFSTVQSKMIGITSMLSCWFFLLFVVPTTLNVYISNKSELITPIYELEMKKLNIIMNFEKRAIDNAVTYKYGEKLTDNVKKYVLSYYKNEFKKIHALEKNMRQQMKNLISLFHRLSAIFPTTFYQYTNNEISSRGFLNLIDFYKIVQNNKKKFFLFFMNKQYFVKGSSNSPKIESFIKGNSNVFFGQSRFPEYIGWSMFMSLIYIASSLLLSYYMFNKNLYSQPKMEMNQGAIPELNLKQGELKTWGIEGNLFKSQLYTLLSGENTVLEKKGTQMKVTINNDTISTQGRKHDFLYLCHPCKIPGDINANDLLFLMKNLFESKSDKKNEPASVLTGSAFFGKKFKNMTKHEMGQFILEVLNIIKCNVYLIHDIAWGMPEDFGVRLKERMEELRDSGALVLFLTSDIFFLSRISQPRRYFYESDAWAKVVDSLNRVKNSS